MIFIKVTRPDDVPVWLRADAITRVSLPLDRADVNATISCGDIVQEVKEHAQDVVALIEASVTQTTNK